MSFQQEHRPPTKARSPAPAAAKSHGAPAHHSAAAAGPSAHADTPKKISSGMSGWGQYEQKSATADQAKAVTPLAPKTTGTAEQVRPALAAAARGESPLEQAKQIRGEVKMSAADALRMASPTPENTSRAQAKAPPKIDGGEYHNPHPSVGFSGITSNQIGANNNQQEGAEGISYLIDGDHTPTGYAAYGSNPHDYREKLQQCPATTSANPQEAGIDLVNDSAAVAQYALAAQLGIKLKVDPQTKNSQVQVDWAALNNTEISANFGTVKYDNPAQVANLGYQAVMAEIKSRPNGIPGDKEQPIDLTAHSGGGQSSFYTALKLATEGYHNISLAGVDMAMTPHERQVLEALGVNVTNITSHSVNPNLPGVPLNSLAGEGIRTAMGGGQDYYDLNVERQNALNPLDVIGQHGIQNDANIAATLRFVHYLDGIDQHGNFTQAMYDQFLADSHQTGDNFQGGQADQNLISKIGDPLSGKKIKEAGQKINNGFDKAGDAANSSLRSMGSQAGRGVGGAANSGLDALGRGVGTVGNFVQSGLDRTGNLVQSGARQVASGVNALGSTANRGLDAVGNAARSVGSTVANGLDRAGDQASSVVGNVPLVGEFFGNLINNGLDALGQGANAVGNLMGTGLDRGGDALQAGAHHTASAVHHAGQATNHRLDAVGNRVGSAGNQAAHGLDQAGNLAQTTLHNAGTQAGGLVGNLANRTLDGIGQGIGSVANFIGNMRDSRVNPLLYAD